MMKIAYFDDRAIVGEEGEILIMVGLGTLLVVGI